MKRSSIFLLSALAFLVNACERHPAAELPPEHATAFGEHGWSPEAGSKHGGGAHAPAAEGHAPAPAAAAHADSAKAPAPAAAVAPAAHGAEAPAGEAPKFFPEKK